MDAILTNLERIKAGVVALDNTRNRLERELAEAQETLARVQTERDSLKDELEVERQLGSDAQKQLDAFKAQLSDFLA